jgi:hypothetical protein
MSQKRPGSMIPDMVLRVNVWPCKVVPFAFKNHTHMTRIPCILSEEHRSSAGPTAQRRIPALLIRSGVVHPPVDQGTNDGEVLA